MIAMLGAALVVALAVKASATSLTSQPVIDFYYSTSSMHYSPGPTDTYYLRRAPLLHSTDLVNWEYIGHSVPTLDWGSNTPFKAETPTHSYIYTAPSATGPWTKWAEYPNQCFYDCGLLFDDNESPYIAYGSKTIQVAQLSSDLKTIVSTRAVYTYDGNAEGSPMYKIKGTYYILNIDPAKMIQYVVKSTSIFGPYRSFNFWTARIVLFLAPENPISANGSVGGIVDDPQGNWYYMAFCDAYHGGRVPVLAPISFNDQGFPQLLDPSDFGPQWEWNHNPLTSAFSVGGNDRLTLRTASVTHDIYKARNTLTHRIPGPKSSATIKLSYSNMHDGDCAGLVLLRDLSSWIDIVNHNGISTIAVWTNCTLTRDNNSIWSTGSLGSLQASVDIPPPQDDAANPGSVWLRATADIAPSGPRTVNFAYSFDGIAFEDIGDPFVMVKSWEFFLRYRYGIFNFATRALGGSVRVESFAINGV
ncbi:hypothetical protein E4U60_004361 [Claviceps pazoutovae]|uniref:Beta-xylosidase C-terminal Concanavalin A-like domain-containing protein n=1 Tax=Claviceps pazoutovae TaxID=1649127 RepID=A0A9P7M8Y7_9HYPO|nr:hypothetical protein E4U60_004361 [Claviceps pazoutovae]